MRTALLTWDYPPAPSGLSTAAREIAESLVEAGADVTVFTLDQDGAHAERRGEPRWPGLAAGRRVGAPAPLGFGGAPRRAAGLSAGRSGCP